MRLYTELPRLYGGVLLQMPIFNSKGKITERAENALENTLYLYSSCAKQHSRVTDNNSENYLVDKVSIVGSGSQNKIDSDIDIMLVVPKIDVGSADNLKLIMSYVLYCDRPKQEAIDVYIRPVDKFPKRSSRDITSQVKKMIKNCNEGILK